MKFDSNPTYGEYLKRRFAPIRSGMNNPSCISKLRITPSLQTERYSLINYEEFISNAS